ncbi:LuxR C-terminal-related transcriptional regulator [Streptomyces sp. NPDC000404]|uniref:helix-turn-helix transcriptional regulator n=1 Tax=Streptomyces sp. NPDC000404 TaxID=3154253 RepID=UPI00332C5545
MTTDASSPFVPQGAHRVRIAIVSPDILARIRQVFAEKNLTVEIARMPYVEVAVRPVTGGRTGPGGAPDRARGGHRDAPPTARRLCAEYRLSVVGQDEPGPAAGPAGAGAPPPETAAPASRLSRRQHEVMALVSRGARNAEIAERLHLSEKTVKNHLNRIFRRLGAGSRIEAVLLWHRDQRHGRTAPRSGGTAHPPSPSAAGPEAASPSRAPRSAGLSLARPAPPGRPEPAARWSSAGPNSANAS